MGTCTIQYDGVIISEAEESGTVYVKYNDIEIASFDENTSGESSITLPCENKYMAGNLKIGEVTLECSGKIMKSDVGITVNNPESTIYIFDSSRSDNFLFGRFVYTLSTGSTTTAMTSWPYSGDIEGSTANKIVLVGKSSGMFGPSIGSTGYTNAVLKLYPNNTGISGYTDYTLFVNNVYYNGHDPGTVTFSSPGSNITVKIKAHKTGSGGSPTIQYLNSSGSVLNSVTVTSTSSTTYSMDIETVSGGYFVFSASTGCGNFVITDIWLE